MLKLTSIVSETYTNTTGYMLFLALDKYIKANDCVELSFEGATPTSSSFLNSSFGSLIDAYGMDKLKASVKITHLSSGEEQILRKFFSGFERQIA